MADPPNALINEAESPGTRDGPGLSCFLAPSSARLKSIFRTLLTPDEQERLVDLLCGPRRSLALDRRLLALGLAYKALGKVVASHAARRVALRERFEIRRGSDARHLATAAMCGNLLEIPACYTTPPDKTGIFQKKHWDRILMK